jgi:hypothetical protein
MGEMRNANKDLIGKPEGTIPLGRPRCKWDNITKDHGEVGWEVVDRIHLA